MFIDPETKAQLDKFIKADQELAAKLKYKPAETVGTSIAVDYLSDSVNVPVRLVCGFYVDRLVHFNSCTCEWWEK